MSANEPFSLPIPATWSPPISATWLCIALLAAIAVAQSPAPVLAAPTEDRDEELSTKPATDVAQMSRNLWWNREPVVESLELSPTQREAMDRTFADYLVIRQQARQRRKDAAAGQKDPFREALSAADLEAARRAIETRAELVAAEATAGQRLMLSVLELLEPGQLAKVRAEMPLLLSHPWFLQAGADGRRRPQARGRARGAPAPAGPSAERGDGD